MSQNIILELIGTAGTLPRIYNFSCYSFFCSVCACIFSENNFKEHIFIFYERSIKYHWLC